MTRNALIYVDHGKRSLPFERLYHFAAAFGAPAAGLLPVDVPMPNPHVKCRNSVRENDTQMKYVGRAYAPPSSTRPHLPHPRSLAELY